MAVKSTVKITNVAMLLTFAVVIHFVEHLIPMLIPVPGIKLGLANIITLLTLIIYGFGSALTVSVGRSILGSFFTGSFLGFGFWLSITAATASCIVMSLVLPFSRRGFITIISVSIIGAVVHNLTQLTMASIIMESINLFRGHLPFFIIMAVPTGFFTGIAARYLEEITRKNLSIISE